MYPGTMQMETCSLFELPLDAPVLVGLSLVNMALKNDFPVELVEKNKGAILTTIAETEEKFNKSKTVPLIPEVSDRMFCSTCQCGFDGRDEQTEHYKLDWHRFNLKRRLVSGAYITAEEFEDRTHAGDLSSISGSDSDSSSEDEQCDPPVMSGMEVNTNRTKVPKPIQQPARQSNKLLFRNSEGQLLAVYHCVLGAAKDCPEEVDELVMALKSLQAKPCWAILMAGGGHFAGAVFRGNEVLEHKTFHRYTVRAKRGTAQGLRDSQSRSNMPKSAGASLRRYNEMALLKDVQDLLESWSQYLKTARAIFLRAPSHNKSIFFGKKNAPFQKNDPRVCSVPFATRRATFKEVQRVHAMLSTLQVYGKGTLVADITSPMKKDWKKVKKSFAEELPCADTTTSLVPSEEEDVPEGEFEMLEVTIDTLSLREFEVLPKRNHKKKKKAGKKSGRELENKVLETIPQELPASASRTAEGQQEILRSRKQPKACRDRHIFKETDDAIFQLRNDLFTACKTGDADSLLRLLSGLVAPVSGTSSSRQAGLPAVEYPFPNIEDPAAPHSVCTLTSNATTVNTSTNPSDAEPLETIQVAIDQHDGPQNSEMNRLCTQESVRPDATHASPLLNERIDTGGFTLLHVAASAGNSHIVSVLMEAGCDPALRDDLGQTPFSVSADKLTRTAFRKYSAKHPGKYNYMKALIPPPLTAELETKKEEKKRAQKLLKKQREKAEKEEKKRKEEEEAEKKRFASLSDREKRALAAEKRLAAQLSTTATPIANISRCWQCGEDLLGKVPFEYLDFSFCTTRCLQEHRKASRTAKP
ncbi:tRNA endonuclease ANKZF1 isoform X2 [Ambystoma mexicanum]